MGTKVTFKIVSSGNPFVLSTKKNDLVPDYKDGQIIFVEDQCKIYLDFHDERKCYTPDVPVSSSGLHYIGVSTTDPNDKVTIDGEVVEPNEHDMVVWCNKEFMYRKDEDGVLGWFEIGDEEAFAWN